MPSIPLAINAYKRAAGFQPEVRCRNMYVEEDKSGASPDNLMRIDRPGLTEWVTLPDDVRGLFRVDGLFGGAVYAVAGVNLYTITEGNSVLLGAMGGVGRTRWAANYEKIINLSGVIAYQYDGATLAPTIMPDDRAVQDTDVLNNYILLACPDGRFYWLDPGSAIVDPLDFATAESSPDGLVAVRVVGDEAFLLGVSKSEVWQTTGDSEAPFLRAQGRNFDRGCMARDTALLFDNSLFWVGDDGNVYRYSNIPTIISDNGIAQRIRDRFSLPSACIIEADGHKHYVLKIPGQGSFGYDPSTQQWSEFSTFGASDWRPHVSATLDGARWLVGDEQSGLVGLYDPDAATDYGETIERIISGTVALMGLPSRNDSVAIGAGGSDDFTIHMRWKDGQEDFPDVYEELEVRAPADIASMYRLGTPEQPYRTFEIRIVDPVKARISGMVANQSWR